MKNTKEISDFLFVDNQTKKVEEEKKNVALDLREAPLIFSVEEENVGINLSLIEKEDRERLILDNIINRPSDHFIKFFLENSQVDKNLLPIILKEYTYLKVYLIASGSIWEKSIALNGIENELEKAFAKYSCLLGTHCCLEDMYARCIYYGVKESYKSRDILAQAFGELFNNAVDAKFAVYCANRDIIGK